MGGGAGGSGWAGGMSARSAGRPGRAQSCPGAFRERETDQSPCCSTPRSDGGGTEDLGGPRADPTQAGGAQASFGSQPCCASAPRSPPVRRGAPWRSPRSVGAVGAGPTRPVGHHGGTECLPLPGDTAASRHHLPQSAVSSRPGPRSLTTSPFLPRTCKHTCANAHTHTPTHTHVHLQHTRASGHAHSHRHICVWVTHT